MMNNQVGDDKY